ncbi:hypothetical protein QFC24_004679 [Naganishia onofrii]|uniref:Uncharacterized protein n=1 Tax=Naganishia onofrii TaxID=1851511 RepID=A0ACC2XBN1_9TREE|nr:hypothetical protein QFC24_004679 [Naganishia onofrii]
MSHAEQTMRYDQQHRPSRSDPEYIRHPLGLPVSFARSYSTPTESSFPAEASDSLQQFASPHSKRNLFNSAAIYNSWIGSLHSTLSHHRRHSQQLEHLPVDLLPYRRPAYDRHPANQDHHYSLQREDARAYEDNAPARHHHSVTPQKGKKDPLLWRSSEMQQLRATQQTIMRIHARICRGE